ncbi:MAG TPA: SufS family cysteine desulfurase [Tepidisphaeraceae bacterium]|jgi:cysteine desulfurase/selenocysteine lyase|nr:SufS family cysteine desulfurase [Tepidisphaeraceae bacterium]
MSSVVSKIGDSPWTGVRDYDVAGIRAQFPILQSTVHGKPLIYLDNGATTQKPRAVIDAIVRYYETENANIHRGVYTLSQVATDLYEEARRKIQRFINAKHSREIIFTRGTSEGINLVASSLGRLRLREGDEVIVSAMEHHSNIVPWQIVCEQTGAKLRVIPMNDRGELLLDEYEKMLGERTKIISVVHLSNSLGTINPIREMIAAARRKSAAAFVVDGAQWVAHFPLDVQDLDADFYAFSGHKLYGPTGIGVLYGKSALLESMPPYQGGGDMIKSVTFEKTEYADLPNKFEGGTPHIEGGIGLGAAIDWVQSVGLEAMATHEHGLLEYAQEKLAAIAGLRMIGTAKNKASVISFVLEKPAISSYDAGVALDMDGIAIRTGHHCCQPVMDRMKIDATARVSLAAYNTREDIDALVVTLQRLVKGHRAHAPAAPASAQTVVYPAAVAASPVAAAEEIAETFDFFGEREEKTRFLQDDLGGKLPNYFDLLKQVPGAHVTGCVAEVYLVARASPDDPQRLEFIADANAHVVRGLIAMLERVFSGQKAKEILAFDVEAFFRRLGLDQFITQQRRNGLAGMVKRIHAEASKL